MPRPQTGDRRLFRPTELRAFRRRSCRARRTGASRETRSKARADMVRSTFCSCTILQQAWSSGGKGATLRSTSSSPIHCGALRVDQPRVERARARRAARAQRALRVPPVTPNDLRRTYATRLRQHGVEPHLIGVAPGHRDSRMAERVYERMPVESLGRALAERVGDCSTGVAEPVGTQRSGEPSETARSREFLGKTSAQGRNRTADTRIFNATPARRKGAETRAFTVGVGPDVAHV